MTFALRVDGDRWTKHVDGRLAQIAIATGNAAVPVIKGGGYGLGQLRLLYQVGIRDLPWIAVGTIYEALECVGSTQSRVLVLEPFDPVTNSQLLRGRRCQTTPSRALLPQLRGCMLCASWRVPRIRRLPCR